MINVVLGAELCRDVGAALVSYEAALFILYSVLVFKKRGVKPSHHLLNEDSDDKKAYV